MAKSRMEKNKELYNALEEEMRNNKGDVYEEKIKAIDPNLDKEMEVSRNEETNEVTAKKNETKNSSALTVIAKELNGAKEKKNEVVKAKEKKEKTIAIEEADIYIEDPISFTDKLSVEEILRLKIEQQEKIKNEKKNKMKSPFNDNYTPEMMQERIKQHEGVDVRKEARVTTKDYRGLAIFLLVLTLVVVILIGVLLIFKIIKL